MSGLAINLSTRGRPELAWRTLEETLGNIRHEDTVVLVSLDGDDEESVHFFEQKWSEKQDRWVFSTRLREDSTGEKYNRVLELFPSADLYMPMVDYVAQITPGFDQLFLDAAARFPDGIGVICNHLANLSFPYTQAVTRRLTQKLGWLYPPFYPFWFIDHEIDSLARLIGRLGFADTHVRILQRPLKPDYPVTMEYREIEFWTGIFNSRFYERRRLARQIIDGEDFLAPGLKDLLRTHYPLIETRDFMLNHHICQQPEPKFDNGPGDDRYWRLRDKVSRLAQKWQQEAAAAGARVLQLSSN